ncbi:MAG TPA: SIS domain-containing protein [Aquella sp.]|nr:SIS domain-containing protein [Aquella sp.]
MTSSITKAEFWQNHERFLKDNLTTEMPNPKTHNLSQLCHSDIDQAFTLFKQIELDSINALKKYLPDIKRLQQNITNVLANGGKIFLIGCGASGRLAILLKRLWEHYNPGLDKKIISVSSAGDISLIKSVEQFEDNAKFGIKQLIRQGFTTDDLLIGLSASGESPFILAAVEYAALHSQYKPYLVFNNLAKSLLERNPKHIITNSNVNTLELDVGPMALTGSTRLQATTAMQIALGITLCKPNANAKNELDKIIKLIKEFSLEKLSPITTLEAAYLASNEYILYQTNDVFLGLSILADTTERSPTFNLPVYENNLETNTKYSPFYLSLTNVNSGIKAWEFLLGTKPTCLSWKSFPVTATSYIDGFDLSVNSTRSQGKYLPGKQHTSTWMISNNTLSIKLENRQINFGIPEDILYATILYKLCLNSHSTLMMGRLGYFSGNTMLSVKPSNFKLIDRAIRYSKFILEHEHGMIVEYKKLVDIIFEEIDKLEPNQSIVNNVVQAAIQTTA